MNCCALTTILYLDKACMGESTIPMQGHSQELEMGGAKLLGEGSGGHLRPPMGPGQSPGRGDRGGKAPRKL